MKSPMAPKAQPENTKVTSHEGSPCQGSGGSREEPMSDGHSGGKGMRPYYIGYRYIVKQYTGIRDTSVVDHHRPAAQHGAALTR
jgi:hypothetical protein